MYVFLLGQQTGRAELNTFPDGNCEEAASAGSGALAECWLRGAGRNGQAPGCPCGRFSLLCWVPPVRGATRLHTLFLGQREHAGDWGVVWLRNRGALKQ